VEVIMNAAARQTVLNLMRRAATLDPERQWLRAVQGAFAMVTDVPFPTLNGVWLYESDADVELAVDLLADVCAAGMPYGLQAVPECTALGDLVARRAGLERGPEVPLMTLTRLGDALHPEGLVIRELNQADFDLRTEITAAAFEVDTSAIRRATELFARMPGYRVYVGEFAGCPVTSAVSISDSESVGIFDVATPREWRGRGYGAAITDHAIRAGFAEGASWAWLQSSPAGLGVYQRLGLRAVEQWALWLAG
jgi:GNAT superfamily N-acetyltransferase